MLGGISLWLKLCRCQKRGTYLQAVLDTTRTAGHRSAVDPLACLQAPRCGCYWSLSEADLKFQWECLASEESEILFVILKNVAFCPFFVSYLCFKYLWRHVVGTGNIQHRIWTMPLITCFLITCLGQPWAAQAVRWDDPGMSLPTETF